MSEISTGSKAAPQAEQRELRAFAGGIATNGSLYLRAKFQRPGASRPENVYFWIDKPTAAEYPDAEAREAAEKKFKILAESWRARVAKAEENRKARNFRDNAWETLGVRASRGWVAGAPRYRGLVNEFTGEPVANNATIYPARVDGNAVTYHKLDPLPRTEAIGAQDEEALAEALGVI